MCRRTGDAGPHQTIHEGPTRPVNHRWAERGKGGTVLRTRIALVPVEVERREAGGEISHQPISCHLGQDRGRSDRQGRGVAAHDRVDFWRPDEVPRSIDQDAIGLRAEGIEGPLSGETLRSRHTQMVAFGRRGMPNRPGVTPGADTVEQPLPFRLPEHLRIAYPIDPAVLRNHGCRDRQGARPRTSPNLIHSDDHGQAGIPEATFRLETGWSRSIRGPTEAHRARITATSPGAGQLLLGSVG
jgi:hypothetical protein